MHVIRNHLRSAIIIAAFSLSCGLAQAAEPAKKTTPATGFDNPTVGTLGGHRPDAEPTSAARHPAASKTYAAPVQSKVQAESAQVFAPTSLPAAPRADAHAEGPAVGTPAPAPAFVSAPPATGFLSNHLVLSGLIAGLFGTDLGEILYGGTMMGDDSAVMVGYVGRIGVFILLAAMILRLAARTMLGSSTNDFAAAPRSHQSQRQEPSFQKQPTESFGGRREPSFHRNHRDV